MVGNNRDLIIKNGVLITPYEQLNNKIIYVKKGKILSIKDRIDLTSQADINVIDAQGKYIVPGFIDMHVHGGGGSDIMDGKYEDIKQVATIHSQHGTTAFLPTTMTMSKDKIIKSLSCIEKASKKGTGSSEILGVHLEGPYINPERKGAQKEEDIRKISIEEFSEFNQVSKELINLVTLAPELPSLINFIQWLNNQGIITSVGHSDASYNQVLKGINAGLSHVTHTFNAMKPFNHREPGVVGAALSRPELKCELIADCIHVNPVAMKILVQSKGVENIVLVTDSMRATGKPRGVYELGGKKVIVSEIGARLENGTIAGSTLTIDAAINNMVTEVGVSLKDAIKMVTINPAKSLGIENKKGSLKPGLDADIVILNKKLKVDFTIVKGIVVYRK